MTASAPIVATMLELVQDSPFLAQGGLIVALIGLASLVAAAVFFARLAVLRIERVVPRRLNHAIRDLVVREQFTEALTLCRMEEGPLARLYLSGLRNRARSRELIKERMLEVGRHEAIVLSRGLPVLDVVAVISPLLGLLGPVWGMIAVFRAIEIHGVGNAGALAGGIETALYTTFAGLLVAIPTRVAHSFLQSRVDRLIVALEELALELLELLDSGREANLDASEPAAGSLAE
ncbi:MAG: biopolymer transporter [Rickettsiales bacterium]|nr:biopolymer transporter [Rickettsiales bacterium]